jgi:hypothetical protein
VPGWLLILPVQRQVNGPSTISAVFPSRQHVGWKQHVKYTVLPEEAQYSTETLYLPL